MGIFSSIMDKIFRHGSKNAAPAGSAAPALQASPVSERISPASSANAIRPASQPSAPPVDVEAVLTDLAEKKGGGGNWRASIVDLLKLLDLDSSLEARKELAVELSVNAGAHGSAEQNIALHKAVMAQLAANGGKVPESLRN